MNNSGIDIPIITSECYGTENITEDKNLNINIDKSGIPINKVKRRTIKGVLKNEFSQSNNK